ncbi:50S ribosomal protein L11 [Candidatus Woesearchaeota archaeon]|nr:50S ribosomal protein L11 [Candidatus Woesearchaeota archaeon]
MAKEKIEQLVEGGKASAAPPLGPALGPMGVNIGEVVAAINEKTASFKGMQVPITLEVDTETKEYEITVGTPPASALIKKEAGIKKASSNPAIDKVADLKIEQIIKICKMKEDDLLGKTMKDRVKEVTGTCVSMGVMVEGVEAKEAITRINSGEFDEKIAAEKTELTAEELKELEVEKAKLKAEIEKRRTEFEAIAKDVANKFEKKSAGVMKKAFIDAGVPEEVYKEYLPKDSA